MHIQFPFRPATVHRGHTTLLHSLNAIVFMLVSMFFSDVITEKKHLENYTTYLLEMEYRVTAKVLSS